MHLRYPVLELIELRQCSQGHDLNDEGLVDGYRQR